MFGSCPIATKSPSASGSPSSRPCSRSRTRTALTLPSSPSTSSTTAFVIQSILGFARARSSMIGDARNSSRRWTTVTLSANFVRKIASSIAESPPPTTTTFLLRKKAASQTAQYETPRPWSSALGLEPELARARAGRDDHRTREVLVVADLDPERPLREVDRGRVVGDELGAEALGLAPEVLHHRRAEDPFRIAGVVLDVARDHQLAAEGDSLDHERVEVRARSVERGRVSGRPAADDDQVTYVVLRHLLQRSGPVGSSRLFNESDHLKLPRPARRTGAGFRSQLGGRMALCRSARPADQVHDLVPAGDEQLRDQSPVAALPRGLRAHQARDGCARPRPGPPASCGAHVGRVARELAEAGNSSWPGSPSGPPVGSVQSGTADCAATTGSAGRRRASRRRLRGGIRRAPRPAGGRVRSCGLPESQA